MRLATAVIIAGLCLPATAWAESDAVEDAASTMAVDTVAEAAQDIAPAAPMSDNDIVFTITPYGWLAGVSGPAEVSPGLPRPEVDSESSGFFDNLNFFGFGVGEVTNGRYGAAVDIAYVSMTFDRDLDLPPAFAFGGQLDLDAAVTTIDGFYRFTPAEDVDLDLLGGVRLFWVDLGLEVHGPGGTTLFQGDAEDSWADLIIGGRARWTPGRWTFSAQGDLGGGDDTSSWGVVLAADYRFTEHFGVMGGYRWLQFDYGKGDRDLDLTLDGPMIGFSVTF